MKKTNAALLSIISNTALVLLKGTAGLITGSVSVLSEALNSATDIVASVMAFLSVRKAEKPADPDHPYGHGKFENMSGLVESIIIVLGAFFIMYEGVKRAISGEPLSVPLLGISVIAVSATVKISEKIVRHIGALKTDSIALEAGAKNQRMDVYSNLAVLLGLILVTLTGIYFIDTILAFVVSILIMSEAFSIARRSANGLLDISLPEDELNIIKEALDSLGIQIKAYHELRTRKAGSERHIDLHLTVCRDERIEDTHRTMDIIEDALSRRLPGCKVIIHPEPCTHFTEKCPADCYWTQVKKG